MQVLSSATIIGILTSTVRLATPYLFAAIGESFAQSSGVVNLGVEGIMLIGAFIAYWIALTTGNLWLGMLLAMVAGVLLGLLMSAISVTLRAEQGISGIGLYILGLGMASLLFKVLVGGVKTINGFQPLDVPLLSQIPVLGAILFRQSAPAYIAFAFVPIAWWVLDRTTWGLRIKAVGQSPEAADSLGVSVDKVRYATVCLGSALAGLAGASVSLALVNLYQENLTAGMGFIAVALVYFGGWRPLGVLGGALLFSFVNALQLWMQVLGVKIASDLAVMLPYVLTIIVLGVMTNRARMPAALNKVFQRGES